MADLKCVIYFVECFFYHTFFTFCNYGVCRAAGQVATQVRLPGKTPGGIGFALIFCFFFIKEKEKEEGGDPIKKHMVKEVSLLQKQTCGCLALRSFVLKQKNQRVQEYRIASGRHSAHRAWVATLKVLILQTVLYG